jgi:hypothetical protein
MKCKVVTITIALFLGLSNVLMSEDLSSNPKSTGTESLIPPNATYFIGEWIGEWDLMYGRQEAKLLFRKGKDGNYYCTYSWSAYTALKGNIPSGSSSGMISFKNENTALFKKRDYTITFIKKDENTLKGRFDRVGPTETGRLSFFEGYFKRVNK